MVDSYYASVHRSMIASDLAIVEERSTSSENPDASLEEKGFDMQAKQES